MKERSDEVMGGHGHVRMPPLTDVEKTALGLDQLRAEGQPPDDKRERTLELLIMEFVKLFPMRHEQDSVLQHARDVAADVATLRQQLAQAQRELDIWRSREPHP